jgi:hypothetical protein
MVLFFAFWIDCFVLCFLSFTCNISFCIDFIFAFVSAVSFNYFLLFFYFIEILNNLVLHFMYLLLFFGGIRPNIYQVS